MINKNIERKESEIHNRAISCPSNLYVYDYAMIFDTSLKDSMNCPKNFEIRDKKKLKYLIDYIEENQIHSYSTNKIMFGNYKIRFLNGSFSREYYLNTRWKKDSVCFVPRGYQYYIPMHIDSLQFFFDDAISLQSKKFNVSDIKLTRKVYSYARKNKIVLENGVMDDSKFPRITDKWLNYTGSFYYETQFSSEDVLGVREMLNLKKQFPNDEFSIKYNYYINVDSGVHRYGVVVFCDQSFYEKFIHPKKSNWTKFNGFFEVVTTEEKFNILNNIR